MLCIKAVPWYVHLVSESVFDKSCARGKSALRSIMLHEQVKTSHQVSQVKYSEGII